MDFESYLCETRRGRQAHALAAEAVPVFKALLEGTNLTQASDVGRAAVAFFPLGHGEGVLRYYRRGGWMAKVMGDRYLGNRMLSEFAVTRAYFEAGGAVPQPLGVAWEQRGPFFRGAIATRRLPGKTLLHFLSESGGDDVEATLLQTGAVLRQMHDYGLWHADLQVKNILAAEASVWVIDFDKARIVPQLGERSRVRNLLRLRRSFEKHRLSLDNFATILDGYGPIRIPSWLNWMYRVRGASARFRGEH